MSELKACPFCDSEDIEIGDGGDSRIKTAICRMCSAYQMLSQWNTRPTEDKLRERVKELEAIQNDWIEREALCCPEDRGFEEMIKYLEQKLESSEMKLKEAVNGLKSIKKHYEIVAGGVGHLSVGCNLVNKILAKCNNKE